MGYRPPADAVPSGRVTAGAADPTRPHRPGRRRQALILLLVLLGHAAVLGYLGLQRPEIRALFLPSGAPPAVPVILWPAQRTAPAAAGAGSARPYRPRLVHARPKGNEPPLPPGPPAPAPVPSAGAAPAAGEGGNPGVPGFGPNLFGQIRPAVGCAHPDSYRLSEKERAECDRKLGELARSVPDLGTMTPPDKAAKYEQTLHCRRIYDDNNTPTGNQLSNAPGGITGLGYVPSVRDCPPGEH